MTSLVSSVGDTVSSALDTFGVFSNKPPDVWRTGIGPVDRAIGGLFKGSLGVLALDKGVGKSSTIIVAAMESPDKTGIISLEDTPEVVGSRILALKTGIDSLDIRLRRLSPEQRKTLKRAEEELRDEQGMHMVFAVGGGLPTVMQGLEELAAKGCKGVFLDYLQKVRGHNRNDRRNEVGETLTKFQTKCAELGMAAMALSQFNRMAAVERPRLHHLRETGDIEIEARLVVLGWRDKQDYGTVHYVIEKSTFGGEGVQWTAKRDASGTLREVDDKEDLFS